MFVFNPVTRDRRVLKEASSLRTAGMNVTIVGIHLPRLEHPLDEVTADGTRIIRVPVPMRPEAWRPHPRSMELLRSGIDRRRNRAMRLARHPSTPFGSAIRRLRRPPTARGVARRLAGLGRRLLSLPGAIAYAAWTGVYLGLNSLSGGAIDWLLNVRQRFSAFSRQAAELAPLADVYHGHDFSGIGAALRARRRNASAQVIYDSHELYTEAGTLGSRPRIVKWIIGRFERRAYREADALVTVNRQLAAELHRRYGSKPTVLVHNCPPLWPPDAPRHDLIRQACDVAPDAPVALYQGGLTEVRGIRQITEALLLPGLERLQVAIMGFGPMEDEIRGWASSERFDGRLHLLPAVAPDEMDAWVASADVSLMPNQPENRNEWLSTPNKLFESIAVGVPVVSSDFPMRREIVLGNPEGPLGALCDPVDPASIAAAILSIIDAPPEERDAMRGRCLAAAAREWNWARQEAALLDLYRSLQNGVGAAP